MNITKLSVEIPDVAKRLEAERLRNAWGRAEELHGELSCHPALLTASRICKVAEAAFRQAEAAWAAASEEYSTEYWAKIMDAKPEVIAADTARVDARNAYRDLGANLAEDGARDDRIARCALSGVPLFETDDVVEIGNTGNMVLRCLLQSP